MTDIDRALRGFVEHVRGLHGDAEAEASELCERLFRAFGWPGVQGAGAALRPGPDGAGQVLEWAPRMLLVVLDRGASLAAQHQAAFERWQDTPWRPRFVVLCNFAEVWVHEFARQLFEPVERLALADLPEGRAALGFMLPAGGPPRFTNDRLAATRGVAERIAALFGSLLARGVERGRAQRFALQCVLARFAEDVGLLPQGSFERAVAEGSAGAPSQAWPGDRLRRAGEGASGAARPRVGGGLLAAVGPLALEADELALLAAAGAQDWSKVEPAIFGTLLQASMERGRRHALGAHFTSESDIYKIVLPTIVRPWQRRIAAAAGAEELLRLRAEVQRFAVLDPACGTGNFLCVAYQALVRVEAQIAGRLGAAAPRAGERAATGVRLRQLHGLDIDPSAVALAKASLLLTQRRPDGDRWADLDATIVERDALFCEWPAVDAIVGNPPFQAKNKLQAELGLARVREVRARYPEVPGRADYCVYWFRRAHDELRPGGRAGLVGTNTIRQNASREGGLDVIVRTGTITEAVASAVWSGDAAVNVSIVNWRKGAEPGKKRLSWQDGDRVDAPWHTVELDAINAALSPRVDVTAARPLWANASSRACYQGQTPGHAAFLVRAEETLHMTSRAPECAEVLFPFLIGDDLLGRPDGGPSRHVIDFQLRPRDAAERFVEPFERVMRGVLSARESRARGEADANLALRGAAPGARVNQHHRNFLRRWWQLAWPRPRLIERLAQVSRYIVCVRSTRRPIFAFVDAAIRPGDALQVFPLADDYSFGVLQSDVHWQWFVERCSTLKRDFRYTSDTVFDPFPWPQDPTLAQVRAVAECGRAVRAVRARMREANDALTLRQIYRAAEKTGASPLRDAHAALDAAVRAAYGVRSDSDVLVQLLALNRGLAAREERGEPVVTPGLPALVERPAEYVSADRVRAPALR